MKNINEKQYLTEDEVAELLGVSRSWLQQQRRFLKGPPFVRLGELRPVRYERVELLKWLEEHRPSMVEGGAA